MNLRKRAISGIMLLVHGSDARLQMQPVQFLAEAVLHCSRRHKTDLVRPDGTTAGVAAQRIR